jgi:phosphonate transport system substrate-binding protein
VLKDDRAGRSRPSRSRRSCVRGPSTAYGNVYNLEREREEGAEAFFTFPWEGSALLNEFKNNDPPIDHFLEITYKQHWQIVRDVDKAMDVSYACK